MRHDVGKAANRVPQPGTDERDHGQHLDGKKNYSTGIIGMWPLTESTRTGASKRI
jgi:hypothetical protein